LPASASVTQPAISRRLMPSLAPFLGGAGGLANLTFIFGVLCRTPLLRLSMAASNGPVTASGGDSMNRSAAGRA
jgi:hypothetical protein